MLAHLLCAKTTHYTPGGGRGGVRGRKGVDDVRGRSGGGGGVRKSDVHG